VGSYSIWERKHGQRRDTRNGGGEKARGSFQQTTIIIKKIKREGSLTFMSKDEIEGELNLKKPEKHFKKKVTNTGGNNREERGSTGKKGR